MFPQVRVLFYEEIRSDAYIFFEEVMLTYYRRLYPFKSMFNWLNHEHTPTNLFTHREFAFTLAGDVYLRYNSFNSADELKKQVCQLNPTRFEIGPVYSTRVRAHTRISRCYEQDPLTDARFLSQKINGQFDQAPSTLSCANLSSIST
jgi:hypothetical protein